MVEGRDGGQPAPQSEREQRAIQTALRAAARKFQSIAYWAADDVDSRYASITSSSHLPGEPFAITTSTQFDLRYGDGLDELELEGIAKGGTRNRFSAFAIGHYDPGRQKFCYYPELVTPKHTQAIEQLAKERKTKFDSTKSRYDYIDPVIRDLWREQREVLEDDIYAIADLNNRHYAFVDGSQEVLVDDATSWRITVGPNRTVWLNFLGAFYRTKTNSGKILQVRHSPALLLYDPADGDYLNEESSVMTQRQFGKVRALVAELERTAIEYPNLDKEKLVLVRSKRSSP